MIPVLTTNPRSGTHYLKAMISAALAIPPLEQDLTAPEDLRSVLAGIGGHKLVYWHFRFSQHGAVLDDKLLPGLRLVVLTRHPFDRLVSQLAWEKAFGGNLPHPAHSPQRLARDLLLGHWDGKAWPSGLIVPDYAALHNWYLRDLVTDWVDYRHSLLVRYEDLIADPAGTLRRCLIFFDARLPDDEIAAIVQRIDFASLSGGRSPGEIDPASHYRNGLPGEWLKVFRPADLPLLKRKYAEAFERTGYRLPETLPERGKESPAPMPPASGCLGQNEVPAPLPASRSSHPQGQQWWRGAPSGTQAS